MPPRPPLPTRRWLSSSTRILRHAPRLTTKPDATVSAERQGKQAKRIGYVVPVKAFSQETQAFLKDEEGLSLGEVLKEGEEGEGVVGTGSVVEMRR